MEILHLPEPAKTLLNELRVTLEEYLGPLCRKNEPWQLGGGTILAARWKHRDSSDADLTVPEGTGLRALYSDINPKFALAMINMGAIAIDEGTRTIKVKLQQGRIEITEKNPRPALGHQMYLIDGHPTMVRSNAQILTGKLSGRGMDVVSRDLFDYAVAGEKDPDALAAAINAIGTMTLPEILIAIDDNAAAYRRRARNEILSPTAEFAHLLDDAPECALDSIRNLRTTAIGIQRRGTTMIITTKRGNGERIQTTAPYGMFKRTMQLMGFDNESTVYPSEKDLARELTERNRATQAGKEDANGAIKMLRGTETMLNEGLTQTIDAVWNQWGQTP